MSDPEKSASINQHLDQLLRHLTDIDALDTIVTEGLHDSLIPNSVVQDVVSFALHYYYASGCRQALSSENLYDQFPEIKDQFKVDLDEEPTTPIELVIDQLKAQRLLTFLHKDYAEFTAEIFGVKAVERLEVFRRWVGSMVEVSMTLERGESRVDVREAGSRMLRDYDERHTTRHEIRGLSLGIPEVDGHLGGIRPGELCVLAAPPKVGKSYTVVHAALAEHQRGRKTALVTLENKVQMTLDRMACMATGVDTQVWDQGGCSDEEYAKVKEWLEEMEHSETPLLVLQPDIGDRSFETIVQRAQIEGVESLIIDQLTFVELASPTDRRPRHQQIGDALHRLKAQISGKNPLSCLLVHQINREGAVAAMKVGELQMWHLAESAEIERTADFVLGLFASEEHRVAGEAKLQVLAARRTPNRDWLLRFLPHKGLIRVQRVLR